MSSRVDKPPLHRSPLAPALGLLLVALFASAMYSLSRLSSATEWVNHTDQVRIALGALLSTLVDAETGARGYAMTGEIAFLEPNERAISTWRSQLDHVRQLTADNPEQQARLALLEHLAGNELELLTRLRSSYDAGHRGAELSPAMVEDKRSMDELRTVIANLQQEERRLDVTRQREATSRWRWTTSIFLGGAIASVLAVAVVWRQRRDADERRLRAEEVSRAHELFRVVLEGVDMGITVQDQAGSLTYANETAARTLGFDSPAALLQTPLAEIVNRFEIFRFDGSSFPVDQLPSRAAFQGQISDEIPLRFRVRGAREERWSLVRSVPVRDPSGGVTAAINFFREVTEKTRQENQRAFLLRAADELNSSLDYEKTLSGVARLSVPILADWCAVDLVDGAGTKRVAIAHVDPAKLEFVGELERRYPSDPNSSTGVPQIIRTGQPEFMSEIPRDLIRAAAVDEEHLRLIDELQLHSYIGVPLRVRGRTIGALTFAMAESGRQYTPSDLDFAQALADRAALAIENARLFHEIEKAREELADQLAAETQRRREAEETSRFAETFIGILGHDLRNPLNAITMAANLLRRKGADGDPTSVDRILLSARRMSNMVDQLLDLTRSRLAGGIPVERKLVDLSALVSGIIDEMRLIHGSRDIRWKTGAPHLGRWDQDRIAQVVSNLIGNALEHGDPSMPIEVELSTKADNVTIAVHNHGTPIPVDLLSLIFEPYHRTSARSKRSSGLGLGLFITDQIVRAHGGRVDVRSDAASGTTFTVILPGEIAETLPSPEELPVG